MGCVTLGCLFLTFHSLERVSQTVILSYCYLVGAIFMFVNYRWPPRRKLDAGATWTTTTTLATSMSTPGRTELGRAPMGALKCPAARFRLEPLDE